MKLSQILRLIEHVSLNENVNLRLLGILPTMVEKGSPAALNVLAEIWNGFPAALETTVPRADAFARASAGGVPVAFLTGSASPEARRFQLVAEELEARMDRLDGTGCRRCGYGPAQAPLISRTPARSRSASAVP